MLVDRLSIEGAALWCSGRHRGAPERRCATMPGMARHDDSLISQIESDALDERVSVATALRKCIVLGGKSGSEQLRDWATRELQGYHGRGDLPDYRIIAAPLMVDGIAGNYQVKGQQFPPSGLPEFAREHISEKVELRDGVGSIEALGQQADIKLQPAMASDLARVMNAESNNPYQQIISIYWSISPTAIQGVLDQIRTALTQLVAELRANMPAGDDLPSAETANQAVNVVVTGERSSVHVTTAQASGLDATATAIATADPQLAGLLSQLEAVLRADGAAAAAETVAHLTTVLEHPSPDQSKIQRLWAGIKLAATTNEAVALVSRIAPLLVTGGPHH
jgi:hypothetical protein